jgi:hypothetical protein
MLALVLARARFATFRAQGPQDYAAQGPAFDLHRHLSGPLVMEGIIYGPTGRVVSRFSAQAQGNWTGDTGTLSETFTYDSGTRQDRAWHLRLLPGGRIEATAADVVGTATGQVSGNSVMLSYRIRLAAEAGGHVLSVRDWMYLAPNGSILNRSQFTKFGITVAELVATIRPDPAAAAIQRPRAMAAE